MRPTTALSVLVFSLAETVLSASAEGAKSNGRCEPVPKTQNPVIAATVPELFEAVERVSPGTTILMEDGEYRLPRMLDIGTPNVVLAGKSGDRDRVVVRGAGMTERAVGTAISISASRVTIAHLTVGNVGHHGIQIRGEKGASNVVVHDVHVVDTGQQLIKGSIASNGLHSEDCRVACSLLEYTSHAPSDYTNGIDVLGGHRWVVRDNRILRIRGPGEGGWTAGPAILFWRASRDTVVERNVVADSYRGIAIGLERPGRK
ncbi:MAG: hypothetical protein ACREQY_07605, partial [Candidatus Binatia bacterium]